MLGFGFGSDALFCLWGGGGGGGRGRGEENLARVRV